MPLRRLFQPSTLFSFFFFFSFFAFRYSSLSFLQLFFSLFADTAIRRRVSSPSSFIFHATDARALPASDILMLFCVFPVAGAEFLQ